MKMAVNIISHDVRGFNVRQREEDGYFDLTGMAEGHGKKINGYLRLKGTEEFLEELEAVTQINATQLVQVIQGGLGEQGTWGHPLVAINCGQWCSAKFAVGVSLLVFNWMQKPNGGNGEGSARAAAAKPQIIMPTEEEVEFMRQPGAMNDPNWKEKGSWKEAFEKARDLTELQKEEEYRRQKQAEVDAKNCAFIMRTRMRR